MIFVAVGTHEQQFNRLVEYIDNLRRDEEIAEEVIIQTGYSTYKPQYCKWKTFFPYMEMLRNVNRARIVITHGVPSYFIMQLQVGKIPVVVPRQKKYNEHVNDHQVDFCNEVARRNGTIIVINEISELGNILNAYESIVKKMMFDAKSNNKEFCTELRKIVDRMTK